MTLRQQEEWSAPCNSSDHQEVRDQMMVMRMQEESTYFSRIDYLSIAAHRHAALGKIDQDMMSETWRKKMCIWSYMVVDHFGFDREVVDISFNYLDRYLSLLFTETPIICAEKNVMTTVDKKSFQLVAATSLYIAIKLHGDSRALSSKTKSCHLVGTFVQLSRGLFTVEDILFMERQILSALQWHLNPPTAVAFVAALLQSSCVNERVESFLDHNILSGNGVSIGGQPICTDNPKKAVFEVAKFFTELSTGDYQLTMTAKPSCVAVASIMNAFQVISNGKVCATHHNTQENVFRSFLLNAGTMLSLRKEEMDSLSHIQAKLVEMCPFACHDDNNNNNNIVSSATHTTTSCEEPSSPTTTLSTEQELHQHTTVSEQRYFSKSDDSPVSSADLP